MRNTALLAALLLPAVVHAEDYGDYHALVIGNNEYEHHPKLKTAVADAEAVAKLLGEGRALIEQNGITREISVLAVPDVTEGEYVLLNLGMAVRKLSEQEAKEVLELWDEINLALDS